MMCLQLPSNQPFTGIVCVCVCVVVVGGGGGGGGLLATYRWLGEADW